MDDTPKPPMGGDDSFLELPAAWLWPCTGGQVPGCWELQSLRLPKNIHSLLSWKIEWNV